MSGLGRTLGLFTILTLMLLGVGAICGYFLGIPLVYSVGGALLFALALNLGLYYYADKWVLSLYGAKVVTEAEAPKIHAMVERIASAARLPKPKVAIIFSRTPNAFATGRSPRNSVVAVTQGALELLTDEELEGVIAHEIAHVRNRDMLINTLAAVIGAAITYILYFSLFATSGQDRERSNNLLALALLVVVPFAVMLVRYAISRTREFEADRQGAILSRKPLALANALRRIESKVREFPLTHGNPSTSHLFIVNPFRGVKLSSLFSTHPPTSERIKRLELMAKTGNLKSQK
jgi:heat shock protein HtpX